MKEITVAPGYSVFFTAGDQDRTFSFLAAKAMAENETASVGGEAVVVRDAHPEGKWGEHSVARFCNGEQTFPFPVPA